MAVLTPEQLLEVRNDAMRDQRMGMLDGLLKGDLAAAISGLNNFFTANEAAINNAIPQPARSRLTIKQKAFLVMLVMAKKYMVG